jgi:TrmH family RNA methyltransferase
MQIGKHSRKLVEVRKALRQGTLTSDGLLPIEGPILLEEAQRSGVAIVDVFFRTGTPNPNVQSKDVHEIPRDIFKSIQETEHSQGVIATVRPREFTLADVVRTAPALTIVLCRLQDPGNVGTILRIGEAFGSTGCIALSGTASLSNSKVVRASAGSIFRLPHAVAGLKETATLLRREGIQIVGTAPQSESSIDNWKWDKPTAVLIGNEGGGLNSDELSYCDTVLRIPHKPTVESLNSAIAAAVILYEASKQRRHL